MKRCCTCLGKAMRNSALTLIVIVMLFCCKTSFEQNERYEGIKNNAFRVYVRIYLNDEADFSENAVTKKIFQKADERLELFVLNGIVQKRLFENRDPKIVHKQCFDEYCEAFVDYKIRNGESK